MSHWPIRWRLTAWYAVAMTTLLVALGAVIYVGLRAELNDQLDEQLEARVILLQAGIRIDGGTPALDTGAVSVPDNEQLLRIWTADGLLVLDSWPGAAGGLTPAEASGISASATTETRVDTSVVGGVVYRRAIVPLRAGDTPAGVLELGISREDVDDTLGALRLLLLVATPLALLAAVAGGYALAGRALAPVETISALARRVSGTDLSARLDLDLPDDELGRLAGTFDDMLDRVEDAFERQRRFTGDAAHELRTPLSLIRTRVDLALARDRPGAEYRETLVELDRDVARLSGLVGTLLTLARSDAGTLTPERRRTDLRETVTGIVEQYREAVTGLSIEAELSPDPVTATVDEDLIVQLLVNLIDNAVAHSPPGGVVAVGCERVGGDVRLWVADTGSGIAPEHLDRLFDRFYRVDTGRTAAAGGVGLGLSICKTIVEAHGGTIRITSELEVGTRVDVTIPTSDT